MGNQPSVPKPGTELQVIGAGFARTGTSSFSEALRILLDGPVYHGGTQTTRGPAAEIRSWIKLLSHWPPRSDVDKKVVQDIIRRRPDGFAAATDAPAFFLVPELLELYPDAMVICTVRDPAEWQRSMAGVVAAATMWFLRVVLLPLPTMRHFVAYVDVLREALLYRFGEREPFTTATYHRHIAWLKETVPADKLVFFDVKDRWVPLCKALGKEVPKDIPFPRINDAEATDKLARTMVTQGLVRWAGTLATVGAAAVGYWFMRV